MSLGFGEILLILLIVLLLFGAKRLPELARGLGQGMREFRKATTEIQDEIEGAAETSGRRDVLPDDVRTNASVADDGARAGTG